MAENRPYRRKRNRRRRSLFGRLFTFFIICLVLFLGISVFFRVREIEVEGDTRYTREEIVAASGIGQGDHLFFIRRSAVANEIRTALPYATDVTVVRRFPNQLTIAVRDGTAVAAAETEGGYLLLDSRCKILEVVEAPEAEGRIAIQGITPILPEVGQVVALGEQEREKLVYLQELLAILEESDMITDVGSIDVTLVQSLSFLYDGRLKIWMGPNKDLGYKMELLRGILVNLGPYEAGTIDLSEGVPAVFRPDPD